MAGYFQVGEEKIRPGSYYNIGTGDKIGADVINGVTAVIFRSNFGPLGEVVELNKDEGYIDMFGTDGTTDALREALNGGALTLLACRLGNGGKCSTVTLQDTEGEDCVELSTRYPGSKEFSITVREKLTDSELKECIIFSGTKEVEKVTFGAGGGEVGLLVTALTNTDNFIAKAAEGKEKGTLNNVSQQAFTTGTDPEITNDSYSEALELLEPHTFNTICLDTEDKAVHAMLLSYIDRIFENGSFTQAVVAETNKLDIETRMKHAAGYDNFKMNYVLNPKLDIQGTVIDGYQTAARIAGMISAVPSNKSLTHTVINNATELLEELPPAKITKAETMGCIVLAKNTKKKVWIDYAINTMINPTEDYDKGWKKIRRVKTRFEMLRRCNQVTDDLVGKVDNDSNGRKTIISNLNDVGAAMIGEGKLNYFNAMESTKFVSDGDSCWFDIDVIDKDSAEHIYCMYKFQFSTNV